MFRSRLRVRLAAWLAAGLLLRLLFVWFPRPGDDDTGVYLQLGQNLLHHGIYGIADDGVIYPSLFRLPGYPLLLATAECLFHQYWRPAVLFLQIAADLGAGLLLAAFARRYLSRRAGEITLALAMLCPFTAVYTGITMTESLSIFAVSLGLYAAGRAIAAESSGNRDMRALILVAVAASLAMLLRPDGAILLATLAGGVFWYIARGQAALHGWRRGTLRGVRAAAFCSALALLPLIPWTFRNWNTFHVFQPLAPRYTNDPGERVNSGFYRWLRTWSVEYVTTANVFWNLGQDKLDPADLTPLACDTPEERSQTLALFQEYNQNRSISPELDDRFNALATQRIRRNPVRYYLWVPSLRLADMVLRPRTEAFNLDVFWWRWREHKGQTAVAAFLGLLNLAYAALAAWSFLRRRVPLAWMLGGYVLLRFLLLATLENPEPRYTLEAYPILILAAAAAFSCNRQPHFPGLRAATAESIQTAPGQQQGASQSAVRQCKA